MKVGDCFRIDHLYKSQKTDRWTLCAMQYYKIIGMNVEEICTETRMYDMAPTVIMTKGFYVFKKEKLIDGSLIKDDDTFRYAVFPIARELWDLM